MDYGINWRRVTLRDAKIWAAEWSSCNPDERHPTYVGELLRCAWPDDVSTLARTLPSIDAFVTLDEVAEVASANAAAAQVEPVVQFALVLDDLASVDADPNAPARLMLALSTAYAKLGRVPTMRDVQRRRVGLPDLDEFEAVGGFRAAVRRWRSEAGAVA